MTQSPVPYAAIAATHQTLRDAEALRSKRISRLRLATFLPGAACIVWMMSEGFSPSLAAAAAVLLLAFGGLVIWHARVEDRIAWHEALRTVNQTALARGARDWPALPPPATPAGVDPSQHPYALDLDLFGRASLFHWLGPAATPGGAAVLADWLLHFAEPDEIRHRQEAVQELSGVDEWRAALAAHGLLAARAGEAEIEHFLRWAEGADPLGRGALAVRVSAAVIALAMWVLLPLYLLGIMSAALWPIPMLAGVVLSFALAGVLQRAFDRAGGGERALGRYAPLLEHVVTIPRTSRLLADSYRRLCSDGAPAPRSMRRLNRILGFAALRRGAAIFHFPIQAVTLWDFWVYFALDRWRRGVGRRVRGWLQALSEADALALLATVRRDNPGWCMPVFSSSPLIDVEAIGHPLIPDDRRVANDVTVGPPRTVLLVTGSNMSGKSTLLRAIGLNVVLAHAGGPVCATRFVTPHCDLQTSIRVQDSLELGLSYFMAALARLKGVVDAAEHERPGRVLLYLLDEILQGTNSAERSIAVRAVARHLLDAGAIGAMTTHDLSLAAEEPLDRAARLVHFSETVDEAGVMRFDYRLRPGLATSRNALRLMQMIGIGIE